ncbi:MAG TPA: ATP-binding protein [Polyangia bacterium]|nr:ATP-binding protein [Polyangia bacterium]
MTLGTRVTVVVTLLVAAVLAGSGYAALKVRRANLEADLDREAHEIATALRAGIEPLDRATADETLGARARAARQHDEAFALEVLSIGTEQRTDDDAWLLLMRAVDIQDAPVGRLFDSSKGPRSYAMAVPLFDAAALELPPRHPARHPTAIMGMRRDAGYIDAEVSATGRRIFPLFLLVVVGVAIGVRLAIEQIIVRPLKRALEGIDAVGKGDLSRVILAERDDEIGTLAGRFNAMTASLREAREETERAASARLGLEARLRQSEKLATIGQMAAEIAHELGTPLNVIGGRARAMGKKAEKAAERSGLIAIDKAPDSGPVGLDAGDVVKNARIIGDEVSRITKIIRQVLDFSRPRGPTVTRVHLGAVVADALEFLREAIRGPGITVEVHTMPAPPEVPGDPDQIQQVCLNLIMNAIHAMPNGGTLRVATERVVRRKGGLDLAPPAEYAALIITDSGPGIPPADREKIFEPFFTTKDAGQGTGLGLAVSHGIVKDHDGWIEVDSPPGGGAEFRVFLPSGTSVSATDEPASASHLAEMESIGKD